jgi:hypothetical protein
MSLALLLGAWAACASAQTTDLSEAWERARAGVLELKIPKSHKASLLGEKELYWFEGLDAKIRELQKLIDLPHKFAQEPGFTVELDRLHNKLLKTSVAETYSGRKFWLSGLFARDRTPYVSLVVEGQGQFIFNPRKLLSAKTFAVDGKDYKIWVSPSIWNKWRSDIVIEPKDGGREWRVMARDMYRAYMETAETVAADGMSYRLLFFDAVDGELKTDPAQKTLAFVHVDKEGMPDGVYLIALESVPASGRGQYELHDGRKVWLRADKGRLEIYDSN